MTRTGLLVVVALAAAVCADTACAQFYKGKTVTMIINYPAGGPTDIEGRIVAQHLPAHIAGKPTIVIKNVGGAGGVIGTNQLAEAAPNGETMGFFTIDVVAQLLANPALRVNYADFEMIAGVEEPLVAYARKDTPPGLKVATDIMQAHEFKALSLNAQNSNTINQALGRGAAQGKSVGVAEAEEVEHLHVESASQLLAHVGMRDPAGQLQDGLLDRARIFGVDVDGAALQRLETN